MPRFAAAALLTLAGCLEFSPHELPDEASERDLHRKALEALAAAPPPFPLRFAVVGDVQRHSDEALDAVRALNARDDLAFVVQLGDFTDFGLAFEYEVMHRVFARLQVPWLVVVGNHDLLANGRAIYEDMFGPLDLAFTYAGVRFVLLNTNSLEPVKAPEVPHLDWLEEQLAAGPAYERVVVFAHAAPVAGEFDLDQREPYLALLRERGSALSVHAHTNHFAFWDEGGVLVVVADHVSHRTYLVLTALPEGGFGVERVPF